MSRSGYASTGFAAATFGSDGGARSADTPAGAMIASTAATVNSTHRRRRDLLRPPTNPTTLPNKPDAPSHRAARSRSKVTTVAQVDQESGG